VPAAPAGVQRAEVGGGRQGEWRTRWGSGGGGGLVLLTLTRMRHDAQELAEADEGGERRPLIGGPALCLANQGVVQIERRPHGYVCTTEAWICQPAETGRPREHRAPTVPARGSGRTPSDVLVKMNVALGRANASIVPRPVVCAGPSARQRPDLGGDLLPEDDDRPAHRRNQRLVAVLSAIAGASGRSKGGVVPGGPTSERPSTGLMSTPRDRHATAPGNPVHDGYALAGQRRRWTADLWM